MAASSERKLSPSALLSKNADKRVDSGAEGSLSVPGSSSFVPFIESFETPSAASSSGSEKPR